MAGGGEEEEVRVCFSGRRSSGESSSSSSVTDTGRAGGRDLMVKVEMDAALALAEFAQMALIASRGGGVEEGESGCNGRRCEGKWGNKGRRWRRRNGGRGKVWGGFLPNVESTAAADVQVAKVHCLDKQHHKNRKAVRTLLERNHSCKPLEELESSDKPKSITRRMPSYKGKPRQQLNEAEKEERRLRRIQANRESARQTIRRRQALCEELNRTAAELSLANVKIKKEIELVKEQYKGLMDVNKSLKEQVFKADHHGSLKDLKENSKDQVIEELKHDVSAKLDTIASPGLWFPSVVRNGLPCRSFEWTSVVKPEDPTELPLGSFDYNPLTLRGTTTSHSRGDFDRQNPQRVPPFLIYQWICPVMEQSSCTSTADASISKEGDASVSNYEQDTNTDLSLRLACDVSKEMPVVQKSAQASSTFPAVKKEPSYDEFREKPIIGFSSNEGIRTNCADPKPLIPLVMFAPKDPSSAATHSKSLRPEDLGSKEAITSIVPWPNSKDAIAPCHLFHAPNLQANFLQQKKRATAAAATEARKRRRELTKIKFVHYRQLKLQC